MKTTVQNVSTLLHARIQRDLQAAAGKNGFLSEKETAKTPAYLRQAVQQAADEFRAANPGKWVPVQTLAANVSKKADALLNEVNQKTGPGAKAFSLAEAKEAARRDATLGFAVLETYQVAAGKGLDLDALAKQYSAPVIDEESVFKRFATEAEALNAQDPDGKHVVWLVRTAEGALSNSYVSGRNDLWAQRFDVDKFTGAITVTGEH